MVTENPRGATEVAGRFWRTIHKAAVNPSRPPRGNKMVRHRARFLVIFSPNEDFVYYRALTESGDTLIYGVNLHTEKTFLVEKGEEFTVINCNDNQSYIVVRHPGRRNYFTIHSLDGNKIKRIRYSGSIDDIGYSFCY